MITIEDRKKRWRDFYTGAIRTIIHMDINYDETETVFPSPDTMGKFFTQTVNRYHKLTDHIERLDDDRIPYISALMGSDIFAHAFGSPVIYPGNSNPFALPMIFSAVELAKLKKPQLENSTLMEIIEYGYKLQKEAPGALMQLPDIQSPLDIAALIWDKTDFLMALYDEPNAVKDLIGMTSSLLTEFLELWFKTFGSEFIAHYPDYYMPFGITLSEDEIGSISMEHFKEFSMPELIKLSEHFGGRIGIHCCANAKHQWGLLKTIPGLVMLNLVQPDDVLREASSFFREGPCQMFSSDKVYDFGAKVVLYGNNLTKTEALSTLVELRKYSNEYKAI
jgi:uroporphyrinogen-III decarboxylase